MHVVQKVRTSKIIALLDLACLINEESTYMRQCAISL